MQGKMTLEKSSVVIVAGGRGLRAGGDMPKQFRLIGNKPMLMHTIDAFYTYNRQMKIVIVLHPDYFAVWDNLCEKYRFTVPVVAVEGGETRFHSVKNGLSVVEDDEMVAVHDAARPFVLPEVIERCFRESFRFQCGVIPVVDEKNSVRILHPDGSSEPFDRDRIKLVQTPQVFPAYLLKKAYDTDYKSHFTDDATVAEGAGIEIRLVEGNEENIKITTPFDMLWASFFLKSGR
jgi:2-C-methyl-D-erythritol 4-phosphate cytidylyltransferase